MYTDTRSEFTWVDRSVASEMLRSIGGNCDLTTSEGVHSSIDKRKPPPADWSKTGRKLPAGYCTYSCWQSGNETSLVSQEERLLGPLLINGELMNMPHEIRFPWKNKGINILHSTLYARWISKISCADLDCKL